MTPYQAMVHLHKVLVLLTLTTQAHAAPANTVNMGLYSGQQFQTQRLPCTTCAGLPQALWYFRQEVVALPAADVTSASYSVARRGVDDVHGADRAAVPGLIWTGASQIWQHVTLNADATQLSSQHGETWAWQTVPRIPSNQAVWNEDSRRFFAGIPLTIRGEQQEGRLIARSIWPDTYRLDLEATAQPLQAGERLQTLVQYANGGARSPYQSRLLWEKSAGVARRSQGKAALGVLLNGAQGDDDEAHGGHVALATGRVGAQGGYADWLVNNYYNLAANSEKGIIAAVTPLDKYMGDLNSGQAFYRPSYMLVAVFDQPEIPQQIQAATNRIYQHFYRNDFTYDHARNNCAGISIDSLRQLGWQVPMQGVESLLKASVAYWVVAITEHSLTKGRAIYDYLNTEMTRLFPASAFDAIGNDLLKVAQSGDTATLQSPLMRQMPQHLQALYFVRIPQFPTSRPYGLAPVYSFAQYQQQAPAERSQWKVIPVTPNPLPETLKEGYALQPETPRLIPFPAIMVLVVVAMLIYVVWRLMQRLTQHMTNQPLCNARR